MKSISCFFLVAILSSTFAFAGPSVNRGPCNVGDFVCAEKKQLDKSGR